MKNILTAILIMLFVSSVSWGQTYPNVKTVFKLSPDKDNVIFTSGREFVYLYKITDPSGKEYRVIKDSIGLAPDTVTGNKLVETIHLTAIQPRLFQRTNKGQTEIIYSLEPNPTRFSNTGAIENKKNVWIHPPRSGFFGILETTPFPYVKFPLRVGTEWTDEVKIHDWWSSSQWLEWSGAKVFQLHYQVIEKEYTKTNSGIYECWVIEGQAHSEIGNTKLTSYFNEEIGFVQLDYETINKLHIQLKLEKVIDNGHIKGFESYFNQKMEERIRD